MLMAGVIQDLWLQGTPGVTCGLRVGFTLDLRTKELDLWKMDPPVENGVLGKSVVNINDETFKILTQKCGAADVDLLMTCNQYHL